MALLTFRGNLNSGHFPFLSKNHGPTVVISRYDQAYQNQVVIGQDSEDKDKGIPQLYYCHNAMPSLQGIRSIGYTTRFAGLENVNTFDNIFLLRDIDENKFLFSPAAGTNYVLDGNNNDWSPAGGGSVSSSTIVTVAYVNGRTFVFYDRDNIYEYDPGTSMFVATALTGVTVGDLHGACSSSGFLILWDDFSIYRSSINTITDFTPDPATGAGASIPDAIKGKIIICLPIANGFMIYTTKNIVSATFTKNIRYPFDYVEVQGSAGITGPSDVAGGHENAGVHYVWSLAGLLKVDKTRAAPIFPEVTDFLTANLFEDFDSSTGTFVEESLMSPLVIKLALISERFLTISYGKVFPYTHAIVHDLSLKRWGKLKITHAALFEYAIPNKIGGLSWADLAPLSWQDLGDTSWADLASEVATQEQPKQIFGVMTVNGTLYTVNFDEVHSGDSGVVVLGKYQITRERLCTIQEIEFENIKTDDNFILYQLSSLNGKTIDRVTIPYLAENVDQYRRYLSSVESKNHSFAACGSFFLISPSLTVTQGGHR